MVQFRYDNVEERKHAGKREIRRVTVRGARGQKSVTTVMRGGSRKVARRRLTGREIASIKKRRFIPRLFEGLR